MGWGGGRGVSSEAAERRTMALRREDIHLVCSGSDVVAMSDAETVNSSVYSLSIIKQGREKRRGDGGEGGGGGVGFPRTRNTV